MGTFLPFRTYNTDNQLIIHSRLVTTWTMPQNQKSLEGLGTEYSCSPLTSPISRGIIHPGLFLCLFTPQALLHLCFTNKQANHRTTRHWRASKVCHRLQRHYEQDMERADCASRCHWHRQALSFPRFCQTHCQWRVLRNPTLTNSQRKITWFFDIIEKFRKTRLC